MNEQQRQNIREILKKAGLDPETQNIDTAFTEMIKARVPGMTSQAQYTAFMTGFDAFCYTMQAICGGNREDEAIGRKTLDQAFDVARKATEITEKLRDVPEAATSGAAEAFKAPPAEFAEAEVQRELLAELADLTTAEQVAAWYKRSKDRRDCVRAQSLRNALYDAIRAKRMELGGMASA